MLVDVQVSSINTSFSTFMTVCASLHASRAACTSSRSRSLACRVFFEGETPFVQLVPQGANLNRTTLLRQPFLSLSQSKIRLGCDPGAQHRFHFPQPGPAMAADRKTGAHSRLLLPASHLINPNAAHLEAPRNLRRTIPALQGSQHALPQILRIGLHLRLPSTSRKYYRMKCIYVNRKRSRPFRSSDVQLGAALPDRIPPFYLPLGFSFPGLPSLVLLRKYSYQTCTFVILTKRRDALRFQ